MAKGNKGGGTPKYTPDMPASALEIMRKGGTLSEVCSAFEIGRQTLANWRNKNNSTYEPELAEAINRGLMHAAAQHFKKGREGLDNPDFNAVLWQMIGRNCGYGMSEDGPVEVPGLKDSKSIAEKFTAVISAAADGLLSPKQAKDYCEMITAEAKAYETHELALRITALEEKRRKRGKANG